MKCSEPIRASSKSFPYVHVWTYPGLVDTIQSHSFRLYQSNLLILLRQGLDPIARSASGCCRNPRCTQRNVVFEDEGGARINGAELYYEIGEKANSAYYSTTVS